VYVWTDAPGTIYDAHAHSGEVSMYITDGDIEFCLEGRCHVYKSGDRIDVPVGILHTATIGIYGCSFVVGEMIEGDS
jgi:quercetin dioxygenase-like cupin family protein